MEHLNEHEGREHASVSVGKSDGSDKSETSSNAAPANSRSQSPKPDYSFVEQEQEKARKLISKPIIEGKTYTTILYEVIAVLPLHTKIEYFQVDNGRKTQPKSEYANDPRARKSRFRIELHLNDELYAAGTGTSKKTAKQEASKMALDKLVQENPRVAQEIERIKSGAPSLKKIRSRRRRNNKSTRGPSQYNYLGNLTYQREQRLADMEYGMAEMMHHMENLFLRGQGPPHCDRYMHNHMSQGQFNENSYGNQDRKAEQNSIFARHSPPMRPMERMDGFPSPSFLNPYEDTLEFMQNRGMGYDSDYQSHDYYNDDYAQTSV